MTIDADKAKVKSSFGGGMFYMPHGLEIDKEGNTWVTDAGLHQVMKFEKGQTKPSLGSFRNFDLEILKFTFYMKLYLFWNFDNWNLSRESRV